MLRLFLIIQKLLSFSSSALSLSSNRLSKGWKLTKDVWNASVVWCKDKSNWLTQNKYTPKWSFLSSIPGLRRPKDPSQNNLLPIRKSLGKAQTLQLSPFSSSLSSFKYLFFSHSKNLRFLILSLTYLSWCFLLWNHTILLAVVLFLRSLTVFSEYCTDLLMDLSTETGSKDYRAVGNCKNGSKERWRV